ncbi:MAG: iron ABC transporter permease [Clostridia bacterium]|nr:iron ABC transporter permease [Clostridia bacterium]
MDSTVYAGKRRRKSEKRREFLMLMKQPGLLFAILVVFAILILFCVYPIVRLFISCLTDKTGQLNLDNINYVFTKTDFFKAFWNSIKLGLFVGLMATVVGFIYAFAVTRTKLPGKKFFNIMAILPILSPPFVISLAVMLLFGRSGLITKNLLHIRGNNIYGFTWLAIVQILSLFPLAYLNLKGMLETLDSSVENAGRTLGASRLKVFLTVTLPLSLPGFLSSFLIIFAKSLCDFGNPQVLAGDYSVLSVSAYLQIVGLFDLKTGSFIALSILLPCMLAYLIQNYWVSKRSFVTVTGKATGTVELISEKKIVIPLFVVLLLMTLFTLLMYGTVVYVSFVKTWGVDWSMTLDSYQFILKRGARAMQDTLLLSSVATPLSALLGMLIAFLLVRKNFFGKRLMSVASILPFAVPGIALGIGYVAAFNTRPIQLTGTAVIIIVAMVFRTLSIGVETGSNSLRQVDPSIEEASIILGAGNAKTFFSVSLPIMKSALFSGLLNSFIRSMTSVSAVIFLVSVNWNLLTVNILSEIESNRLGAASAYCVALMVMVILAVGVLEFIVNGLFARRRRSYE